MNKVKFALYGCDDSTYLDVKLTDKELKFLERLERLTKSEATGHCQPIIQIEEVNGELWNE